MTFLPNNPDPNDPTRQCTCGYRRFRSGIVRTEEEVDRYVLVDPDSKAGFGSVPFGLPFGGGGGAGGWGLLTGTLRTYAEQVTCENCRRVRSVQPKSSFALFGSLVSDGQFCVIVSDVTATLLGCLELQFDGPGEVESQSLSLTYPILPLAVASAPSEVFASPPGPSASMLCADIPPAAVDGEYTVSLVDRCGGFSQSLATVVLENDMIVLNPTDADLNGAPEVWVKHNLRSQQETVQLGSGSIRGIPFDRCDGVIEYDARFGTDPAAQGFSVTGAPTLSLLPGGVLRIQSVGGAAPAFFSQDLTLTTASDRVNVYAKYLHRSNVDANGPGAGFNILGGYSSGSSNPFNGIRAKFYTLVETSTLDGSGPVGFPVQDIYGKTIESWQTTGLQHHIGDDVALVTSNHGVIEYSASGFGTVAGNADPELRSEFGDIAGTGIDTLVRNFVVSGPGRFIRAWFNAFATLDTPVLRLNLVADQQVGSFRTARFLIRYGALAVGADPTTYPANTLSQTVDFVSNNQMFQAQFNLAGISAGEPFWFTVEREWDHPDDVGGATVFLTSATVRAV